VMVDAGALDDGDSCVGGHRVRFGHNGRA
jgi:hypothetical protein